MAFGYKFVDLDDDQKHARRVLLEFYPVVAQWSVLAVFVFFQLWFFVSWLARRNLNYGRPRSPSFSKRDGGIWTWIYSLQQGIKRLEWWMKKPIGTNWGTRGEWVGGTIWTLWLLLLSIVQTGNDYLHLTKRFGIIGASQLPLHYLLAMRSPYSPIQFLTRLSHEQLKSSHQVLGRIIFLLFVLHAVFYMNFFIVAGYLAKRIKDKDVIFGIISIIFFATISTTALGQIRRLNYRVFYISHITIANVLLVTMYLHVSHIRLYAMETMVIYFVHGVLRNLGFSIYTGTIKLLPGTNLIQVRIPLAAAEAALKWKPGQHVYLSKPSGSAVSISGMSAFYSRVLTNPFTVASLPGKDKELLLVARTLNGNTKQMAELARSLSSDSEEVPNIPIALEGPYGSSNRLPDFSTFDKILLVAGGVGATFIIPIYRSLLQDGDTGDSRIRLIWSVRTLAETQWASVALPEEAGDDDSSEVGNALEVFLTRPSGSGLQAANSGEDIELAESEQLLATEQQMESPPKGMSISVGRPDLPRIVDEVFSKNNRVAVLCCGPKAFAEKLGESVAPWVRKGHDVYFHDEAFGW